MYDLIFECGTVIDGTGSPGFKADVGVVADTIAAVGDLSQERAARRINASGLMVCPGFIDIHTHTDITALANPLMDSTIHQGITTQLAGNCGLCVGMALDEPRFALERRLSRGTRRFSWSSLSEYLDCVQDQGIATNFAVLAGHNTVRKRVMNMEPRAPTSDELDAMKALVAEAMDEGAFGLSTGLEYTPGRFAELPELVELARVAAEKGGFYATHLRSEADGLLDSVAEALAIGREAGIPVQLSHHKAEARRNWGMVDRSLAMVDRACAEGLDVALDQYPYTAFMTGMWLRVLPEWAQKGEADEMIARLADPEERRRVLEGIRARNVDWDLLQIAVARGHRELQGRTVAEIAKERNADPAETALDILIAERGMASVISFDMSEEDVRKVMRHPLTAIGSDGVSTTSYGRLGEDRPHPRSYGTFPRVLGRYVRELGLLSWEDAVRKMTSLPASRIGLERRGVLAKGNVADLVAFDPDTVIDVATYSEPHRFPAGIQYVVVAGTVVIDDGIHTGARPGRVLRRGQAGL